MKAERFTVSELKTRLDKFLAGQRSAWSRSRIQRDIEAGLVSVNGTAVRESKQVVRRGDEIAYAPLPEESARLQPTATPLRVLYHDHGLLIVDKPAGLTVHPGAGFKGETLASALLYSFKDIRLVGEEGRPGIVHRLDKDTSGVILVATTQAMYEHLKDAFAERKVKKEYLALVCGEVVKARGTVDAPVGRSRQDFRKYATKDMVEPKAALTEYAVLERLRDPATLDGYTLVLVKLHTGRTHQIRVHFSSLGHPLAGDRLYGGTRATRLPLGRQFLHAKRVEVRLPDGTWIEAESELPQDLREQLEELGSKTVNQL